MSSKDAHLYSQPRPRKNTSKEITASSSLAFTSALSSLLAGSSSTIGTTPRSRKPKGKEDIFTTHNRNGSKRAAADMLAHETDQARFRGTQMDEDSWRRTKRKLEDKARLYGALKRGDVEDENEKHMVDFDRKWAEGGGDDAAQEAEESSDGSDGEPEEMIEYEDEFGRTRKGTKGEAAREERRKQMGERYREEADRFTARPAAPSNIIYGDTVQTEAFNPDEPIAAQMEELAARRDRELTPPDALHYDADKEIRSKGTGFFQFSKDEEERQRQMRELEEERLATEKMRAEKAVDARKEERRKAIEERKKLIREKKDKNMANKFLDSLGEELLASSEQVPLEDADEPATTT